MWEVGAGNRHSANERLNAKRPALAAYRRSGRGAGAGSVGCSSGAERLDLPVDVEAGVDVVRAGELEPELLGGVGDDRRGALGSDAVGCDRREDRQDTGSRSGADDRLPVGVEPVELAGGDHGDQRLGDGLDGAFGGGLPERCGEHGGSCVVRIVNGRETPVQ